VYYVPLPGENKQTTVLKAGQLEQLLSVNAADDLTFEVITFRDSDWIIVPTHLENSQAAYGVAPAVFVGDSTRIRFLGCAFRNIGATALKIGLNSQHCEVRGCLFKDIGATGVFIEGENIPADAARVTRDIVVTDNHIISTAEYSTTPSGCCSFMPVNVRYRKTKSTTGFIRGYPPAGFGDIGTMLRTI
jgi:hypothetical protein